MDFPFLPTQQCIKFFLISIFLCSERNVLIMSFPYYLHFINFSWQNGFEKVVLVSLLGNIFLMYIWSYCSHLPAVHVEDHGWKVRGLRSFGWWNFKCTFHAFCRVLCADLGNNFHTEYLNFKSMKFGTAQARRLSTASSVTKPPHFILTTEWIWYWIDDFGFWQQYGKQVSVMEREQVVPPQDPYMSTRIVLGISERAKDFQIPWITCFGGHCGKIS